MLILPCYPQIYVRSHFCKLLCYQNSELEKLRADLYRFLKHMRQMRYDKPFNVPQELPIQQISRRFGKNVGELWSFWKKKETNFLPHRPWKNPKYRILPAEFMTHHWEVPEWENAQYLSKEKVQDAIIKTFFRTIDKIATTQEKAKYVQIYGIRAFRIHLFFNDDIYYQFPIHLTKVLKKADKTSQLILQQICQKICKLDNEVQSPKETSLYIKLHTLKQVSIEPIEISCENLSNLEAHLDATLFNNHSKTSSPLEENMDFFHLKSPETSIEIHNLQANLTFNHAVSKKTPKNYLAYPSTEVEDFHHHDTAIFNAAHFWRPSGFFSQDQKTISGSQIVQMEKQKFYLFYSETIGDHDYYWLRKNHSTSLPQLWLKSSISERYLTLKNKTFNIIGFQA